MNYIMLIFQLCKIANIASILRFNVVYKRKQILNIAKCNELSMPINPINPINSNNLTKKTGIDSRFTIDTNSTKAESDTLENIFKNMKNKELLSTLENNTISINTKIDLINQYRIIEFNNIFAGGLMKDCTNDFN